MGKAHQNLTDWRRKRRRSGRRSVKRRKERKKRRRRQRKRKNGIGTVRATKELRTQKWRGQEKELKQEVGVTIWTRKPAGSWKSNCLPTHHNDIMFVNKLC